MATRDRKPAQPSAQTDIDGIPVEYAKPPEVRPTSTDAKRSWLAERTHEYDEAWRTGVIEGALWVLSLRTDDHAMRVLVLADLRRRFGAEHVDRRIAQIGGAL